MINNCKLTASLSPGLGNYVELKNCSFFFLLICVSSIATTNSSRFPTIFIIRIKFSETSNKNYRRKEKQPVCECVLEGGKAKPSRGVKTCEQKKNQYVWGLSVSLSACLYVCLSVCLYFCFCLFLCFCFCFCFSISFSCNSRVIWCQRVATGASTLPS